MKRATTASLLFALLMLLGCGGDDEDKKDESSDSSKSTAKNNSGGAPLPSAAGPRAAASGSLAAHAKPLSMVMPNDFAIVKIDNKQVLKSSLYKQLMETMAATNPGDPAIDQFQQESNKFHVGWVSFGPKKADPQKFMDLPVHFRLYVEFSSAAARDEVIQMLAGGEELVKKDYHGREYFQTPESDRAVGPTGYAVMDGATVFVTTDLTGLQTYLAADGKITSSTLIDGLKDVDLSQDLVVSGNLGPFRDQAVGMMNEAVAGLNESPLTKGFADMLGPLPEKFKSGTISMDFDQGNLVNARIEMADADGVEKLDSAVTAGLSLANIGLDMMAKERAREYPIEKVEEFTEQTKSVMGDIQTKKDGNHLEITLAHSDKLPTLMKMAAEMETLKSDTPLDETGQIDEMSTGRELALGALNHEVARRKFPADLADDAGEPLLSWRVAVLPYIEQSILAKQFDKSKAWDQSPNIELAANQISTLKTRATESPEGTTWKMVSEMPGGLLFICGGAGSETAPWTKPDNFELNYEDPAASLGEMPEGGYVVVMKNAAVSRMTTEQLTAFLAEYVKTEEPEETTTTDPPVTEPPVDPVTEEKPPIDILGGGDDDPEPESEPGKEVRTWTTADGRHTVEASFVTLIGGKVKLKRADTGKVIDIEVDKLSQADQDFIKNIRNRRRPAPAPIAP